MITITIILFIYLIISLIGIYKTPSMCDYHPIWIGGILLGGSWCGGLLFTWVIMNLP